MEKEIIKEEATRHNQGKLRYDLLEPFAIEELVKVFTFGAQKYDDNNWLKGMPWNKMLASLKRHVAEWEKGVDFDHETNLYHMAHVAWNALGLVSYYKYFPQGDNRHGIIRKKPLIGLDVDDVVCNWVEPWCELHKIPIPSSWYFMYDIEKLFEEMKMNGDINEFYLNLPPKEDSSTWKFEPTCYISHRPVDQWVTECWLQKNEFPLKQVYHVKNREDKITICKELKLDLFVDDSYETFKSMNENGICCFLLDAKHNQKFEVGHKRIKNLSELPI